MRNIFAAIILCGLLVLLSSCRIWSTEPDEIVIGEIVSLTGAESAYGLSAHNAAVLALEEANNKGGVNGKKIRMITKDTESRKDTTEKVTLQLIEKHDVLAILGEVASERTRVAAPIAQINKIPIVSPASTNPNLTEVGEFVFRTCFIDPFQGLAMAKFAYQNQNLKRVAILRDGRSNYSSGLAEFFIDEFTKLGGEIVAEEDYSISESDFKPALLRVKRNKPDALFIPGYYTQVVQIAQQAKQIQLNVQLLGGDGWDTPEVYSNTHRELIGGFITSHFSSEPKDPVALEFIANYKKKYDIAPDGVAALSYDATKILINALRAAKKLTGDDIRQALQKTKDFPGATGSITINENREAQKTAFILRIDDKKLTFVTSIAP